MYIYFLKIWQTFKTMFLDAINLVELRDLYLPYEYMKHLRMKK